MWILFEYYIDSLLVIWVIGCLALGVNAPLYQRYNENGVMSTLNINASVTYWHTHGMDKNKMVIGLPTYGHSFR